VNFLQLCQRTRQECGITGTGPTAVTGQTGELKRVVDWVAEAYRRICAKEARWMFLRSEFSVNTVADTQAYVPTDCTDSVISQAIGHATVGKFRSWVTDSFWIYLQSAGVGTRRQFWPCNYFDFRYRYQMQATTNTFPAEWTIRMRDNALLLGPKPDAVYVVQGEYYRVAPALTADADEPVFPEDYHMLIVWYAKHLYAGFEESVGVWADSDNHAKSVWYDLRRDWLPRLSTGGPLA
jgi:hypothetical protein